MEAPKVEAMLEGNFRDISLASLLQLLCLERNKSYRIRLSTEHQKGYILVRKGLVIAAQFGLLEGEDAVCEFLSWEDGNFWAQHVIAQTDVETNLKEPFAPNPGFISDCATLMDQHIGLNTEITGSATFGTPAWKELIKEHPLDRECLSVLAWVREGRKMHQALREFGFDIVRATQLLALLVRTQSIQTLRPGFLDPGQQVLRRKISTTGGQEVAAAKLAQEAAKALETAEELSQEAFVSRSYKDAQSLPKPASTPLQSQADNGDLAAIKKPGSDKDNSNATRTGEYNGLRASENVLLSKSERILERSDRDLQSVTSDIPVRDIPVRTSLDARMRAKRLSTGASGSDLPAFEQVSAVTPAARVEAEPQVKAQLPPPSQLPSPSSASSLTNDRKPDLASVLSKNRERVKPIVDYEYGANALKDEAGSQDSTPESPPPVPLVPKPEVKVEPPATANSELAGEPKRGLSGYGLDYRSDLFGGNQSGAETGEIMGIVSPLDMRRDSLYAQQEPKPDDWSIKPAPAEKAAQEALLSFEPGGETKKLAAAEDQAKAYPTLPADDPRVLVRTQSMPVVEMDIERLFQTCSRATQFGKLALGNPSLDPHRRQTVVDAENGCSLATALQDPARSPAAVLASYRYCLDRGYIEAQDTVIPLTADLLLGRIELDQYLLQRRRITGDELRDLMKIARDEGIKLTQLLVTSGFLTQSDVEILRREQRRFAFR